MPKVSRESVAEVMDVGVVVDRHSDLDGYTFSFLTYNAETNGAELLRGLPDETCASAALGIRLRGANGDALCRPR